MHADEYQPPCFKAADANMVAHFTKKPFTMDVGAVNTNHHTVGLKVGSALTAGPLMPHVHCLQTISVACNMLPIKIGVQPSFGDW
jgi:HORMA domain